MSRPKLPLEAYREVEAVVRARDEIPSDKDLAVKWHRSPSLIRKMMRGIRKQLSIHLVTVPRETNMGQSSNASGT